MASDEMKEAKSIFLNRYNPAREVVQATSDALTSASQHNSLYAVGVPKREKAHVREARGLESAEWELVAFQEWLVRKRKR